MSMRSALRLIPLMVIGAVAAFLLIGPLSSLYKTPAVASRPQPTASVTADPHASPTSCPASLPMPKTAPSPSTAVVPTLPSPLWVNDPLGVNVRTTPAVSGGRVTTLAQGVQANADSRATDSAGSTWYHITVGSQNGWVRSDFVVLSPVHPVSGTGWSMMVPQADVLSAGDSSVTTFAQAGDQVPFMTIQTSASPTISVQMPATVRADLAPVGDQAKVIQVWNYTVTKHTSRVALDTCKVASAWARPDQGWPYVTTVFVHAPNRNYLFAIYTSTPDMPVIDQVLNSIALS